MEAGRAGTCYRAANWKLLGETTGRGRMDCHHQREGLARKQVFVYPLVAHATEVLCGEDRAQRNIAKGAGMVCEGKKDRGERTNQKWQEIRKRFDMLKLHLNERSRRYWLGAEALAYGRGGLTVVSEACGVSHRTVVAGLREVQEATTMQDRSGRIRRPGGGSKPIEERLPEIKKELEKLVDPCTRGDPESPLRWTSKSVRKLATELTKCGFPVGADTVARLLRDLKYRLQANRKTSEGKQHPDRDAQFCYIAKKSKEFLETGDPVISVDTKKENEADGRGPFGAGRDSSTGGRQNIQRTTRPRRGIAGTCLNGWIQ